MSSKSIIRFAIGAVIAFILLSVVLPMVGVPRSEMLFPAFAYANASAETTGVITAKKKIPTSNWFKVGDYYSMVDYEFQAANPPGFGGKPVPGPANGKFIGEVHTEDNFYETVKVGQSVPIKYDPTYPSAISGIKLEGAGRNGSGGASIISMWLAWAALTLFLAFFIGGFLERIMLRESY